MSTTDNEKNVTSPDRTPLAVLVRAASILAFAVLAGCGSAPFDGVTGSLPESAKLALSPSGQQLLVSWQDGPDRTQAKLLTLSGTTVMAVRDVPLPQGTNSTAWGPAEHQVLVTTVGEAGGELVRIDLQRNERTVLHKSAAWMRYPLEIADDTYVFLEGNSLRAQFSRWKKLQKGTKTLLSDQVYSMASSLDQVRDALFLLEPRDPPVFRVFQGELPAGLASLIDAKTWVIECAETVPLICVRTRIHYSSSGRSFGTMELINGNRRCAIGDRWRDPREILISRDGSTVAFHAAAPDDEDTRAIYIVKTGANCAPEQIKASTK